MSDHKRTDSDSTRRALRTGIDALLAVLGATAAVVVVPGLDDALGLTGGELARAGVIVGALALFLTKLRNALEDRGTIPAILKAPASDGADPIPPVDEAGYLDRGLATLVAAIVIGGLLLWLLVELLEVATRR